MPPKPAVDKSPHRNEIIEGLLNGESARSISKWLKDSYNESINHSNISRYKSKYLNVVEKAKEKVEKRRKKENTRKKIAKAVDKEVEIEDKKEDKSNILADGIEALLEEIKSKKKVKVNPDVSIVHGKETPMQKEKFKHNYKKSMNDDIRLLNEIYKDDPEPPTVNVNIHNYEKALDNALENINNEQNDTD